MSETTNEREARRSTRIFGGGEAMITVAEKNLHEKDKVEEREFQMGPEDGDAKVEMRWAGTRRG